MTRVICVFFALCLSVSLAAAVVTTSAAGPRVRFTSPGATAQIRVRVFFGSDVPLFDSAWKDGNVLDWPPGSLADGTYRCVVMVRDLQGEISEKESALIARGGEISIDERGGSESTITLLAHDGTNGEIVTTSGDLKFSFGDFLA